MQYTKEQIKEIFQQTREEVVKKLENEMEEQKRLAGKETGGLSDLMFNMQNMMVATMIEIEFLEKLN